MCVYLQISRFRSLVQIKHYVLSLNSNCFHRIYSKILATVNCNFMYVPGSVRNSTIDCRPLGDFRNKMSQVPQNSKKMCARRSRTVFELPGCIVHEEFEVESDHDGSAEASVGSLEKSASEHIVDIPPVHVVSRIPELADCIMNFAPVIMYQDIVVSNISVPEDSDTLDETSLQDLQNAKIVVIDPVFLAANHQKMLALEWAHSTWAGVESVLASMTNKPKFLLTRHASEAFGNLIAEYVLAQVLSYERAFKILWRSQEEKNWTPLAPIGRSLDEITISLLGVGSMAQAIAKCFKAHGTKIIALARTAEKKKDFNIFDRVTTSIEEALTPCNYLVNVLPHTSLTAGLLNGDVLSACFKCPVFINVGRGSIIDEASLINAIESNWISGAVLDVFNEEPLPSSSPLWEMDMVTITPHCAAISRSDHVAKSFLKALLCYKEGSPLPYLVNWETGY